MAILHIEVVAGLVSVGHAEVEKMVAKVVVVEVIEVICKKRY